MKLHVKPLLAFTFESWMRICGQFYDWKQKEEFCWLNMFNFTSQARRHIFKQRKLCVCTVFDCWNTGICFWPVPIKIRPDTTISSLNVPATQTESHWCITCMWGGKEQREGAGKRTNQRNSVHVSELYIRFPLITPNLDICRVFTRPS